MERNKTLLIIPAYNEEETIRELVERGKKYIEVCVIDDHSSDKTPHILRDISGIHIITHEVNTHIPGAVLDGMQYAVIQNYDYAITMDAGLSHNPDEIPRFLDAPDCDLVIGVRTQKIKTPLYRKIEIAGENDRIGIHFSRISVEVLSTIPFDSQFSIPGGDLSVNKTYAESQ